MQCNIFGGITCERQLYLRCFVWVWARARSRCSMSHGAQLQTNYICKVIPWNRENANWSEQHTYSNLDGELNGDDSVWRTLCTCYDGARGPLLEANQHLLLLSKLKLNCYFIYLQHQVFKFYRSVADVEHGARLV